MAYSRNGSSSELQQTEGQTESDAPGAEGFPPPIYLYSDRLEGVNAFLTEVLRETLIKCPEFLAACTL